MPLESASYISGLNASNPVGATDLKSSLDDHLRLIKSVLLGSFPGIAGAVTSSHTELNYLDGATGVTGTGNTVRSASPTFTGTLTAATVAATTITGAGSGITALNADNLASGTLPDARFPATLPAKSGVNLTNLNASNLASGTIPDARFPATLPALSGANLTALNGSNIASGTVADARIASTIARNNSAQTISGQYTFSTRPKFTSAGGFLSHASSSNTGGKVTLSSVVPATAADVGSAGDIRLVY